MYPPITADGQDQQAATVTAIPRGNLDSSLRTPACRGPAGRSGRREATQAASSRRCTSRPAARSSRSFRAPPAPPEPVQLVHSPDGEGERCDDGERARSQGRGPEQWL